jgi:hypothetical protein
MRKALPLAVLLMFSWLQGYQLCDASEDTTETLQDVIAPTHNPQHAAITAPDEEYDTAIPLVVGQTLQPGTIQITQSLVHQAVPSFSQPTASGAILSLIQDKSPPTYFSSPSQPLTSLALDRTPAHTLAPPLA